MMATLSDSLLSDCLFLVTALVSCIYAASKIQHTSTWNFWLRRGICGSFFLWLSFSRSQVVKKKSHQMTPFFQNEDWEQNDVVLVKTLSFGTKKKLSFDDFLMTTWERENESQRKKGTTNSASIWLLIT